MRPRYVQAPKLSLADRPFPRRDLVKKHSYLTTHVFEATRGCVHSCEFCVVPTAWGLKPFQKPVADVVADIRQHYARKIIFIDLNLIADKDYAARLFEALIPLRIKWFGLSTTLLARDKPLLALAARSGCTGLLMGFESILPANLKQSKKGFNSPGEYRELVELLHQHGITLMACFTFGMDADTPEVFMKTARFAVEAHIDLPRFAIVTPFPSTGLYNRLEAEGRILTKNWELYDAQHVVFQPAQMSPAELYAATSWPGSTRIHLAPWPGGWSARASRCPSGWSPTWATASTPIICAISTTAIGSSASCSPSARCRKPWAKGQPKMKITLVHPCIGRRVGQPYIRTWQMEPLPPAVMAGLTPRDVDVAFYDDRMETINYDEPHRPGGAERGDVHRPAGLPDRQRIPPQERAGGHGRLPRQPVPGRAIAVRRRSGDRRGGELVGTGAGGRRAGDAPAVLQIAAAAEPGGLRPDRSIYAGKRYLPIGLVEAGRGCHFVCDFCAVQTIFNHTQTRRPPGDILEELGRLRDKPLIFFVDDNITSNMAQAKEFFRALIPLKLKWVSQASINAAHDEEFLELIVRSGCQGLLIGFESLNPANLKKMNKGFNTMQGGFETALANLRRHNIRLYITFIFGYDEDTEASFSETVAFALKHKFYIGAFNHLTPFPGTPLYKSLEAQGRLLYHPWWLDERYSYNRIPFQPVHMSPERLQAGCVRARAGVLQPRQYLAEGARPGEPLQCQHVVALLRNQLPVQARR
jgi:radical SAM superfamily enzyme YgiQ (UPF0313 family)